MNTWVHTNTKFTHYKYVFSSKSIYLHFCWCCCCWSTCRMPFLVCRLRKWLQIDLCVDHRINLMFYKSEQDKWQAEWNRVHNPTTTKKLCSRASHQQIHFHIISVREQPLTDSFSVAMERIQRIDAHKHIVEIRRYQIEIDVLIE